jgi:hypothetical protein
MREIDMNFLNYEQVEEIANCGIFWVLKNLDTLLKQHFAGDKMAAEYIEMLYVNAVYEKEVVVCE